MNARKVIVAIAALGLTVVPTPTQAAPEVFGLRYMATSQTATNVSWFKANEAVSYKVYVNGVLAATVTDPQLVTSIQLPTLLGPKDVVTAVATDQAGASGSTMTATYRYLFDPYAPYIGAKSLTLYFDKGSGTLTAAATEQLNAFVAMMKLHGFTQAKLIGYNAVRVGTVNALTMAQLRADNARSALNQLLPIPTVEAVKAVKVARGAAVPDTAARVELLFR